MATECGGRTVTIKKTEAGGIVFGDHCTEIRYNAQWGAFKDGVLLAIIIGTDGLWDILTPDTLKRIPRYTMLSAREAKTWAIENL